VKKKFAMSVGVSALCLAALSAGVFVARSVEVQEKAHGHVILFGAMDFQPKA